MILWVDDDTIPSLRAYYDELIDAGYHVEIARDPDEMWDKLAEYLDKVNCIIMDILLPTGNSVDREEADMGYSTGLVLLQHLKNDEKFKDIPLIILTILNESKIKAWAKKNNIPFCNKQETTSLDLLKKLKELKIPPDRVIHEN